MFRIILIILNIIEETKGLCSYRQYYYITGEALAHELEGAEIKEYVKMAEMELLEIYKNADLTVKSKQLSQRGEH